VRQVGHVQELYQYARSTNIKFYRSSNAFMSLRYQIDFK